MDVFQRTWMKRRGAIGWRLVCSIFLAGAAFAADEAPVRLKQVEAGAAKWSSLAELQKAAEKGDAEALMELGAMYEFGREVPEDPAKARSLYREAAAAGVAEGHFRLGRLMSEGLGGPVDLPGAFARYLNAARAGMPLAQYNVGAMLASARGVRRNYVEGLAWIILASRSEEVDPTGERKLRERLARRPKDIAAAEVRAIALQQELDKEKERVHDGRTSASGRPRVDVPVSARPQSIKPVPPPSPGTLPKMLPPPRLSLPPAASPKEDDSGK
jgi:TPR repeat protein